MIQETFGLFFSSWYVYLIFGLVFGSFLNVVIYRVPNGMSLISPPSSCPKCGHRIKWHENIPVFSWIILGGKCSSCKTPISSEYPIIEGVTGLITLGLFYYFGPTPELFVFIALAYTLLCISIIDYKTYSIPYGLNITLFVIAAAGVVLNLVTKPFLPTEIIGSLAGAATGFGILFLLQIAGKLVYKQDAVGTGDLYLLGSAGLLLGPKLIFTAFILGSLVAVAAHAVPSVINITKKKKDTLFYKEKAEEMLQDLRTNSFEIIDILGLRLQLSKELKDGQYDQIEQELNDILNRERIDDITKLRLFFRFSAVKDNFAASDILKKVNIKNTGLLDDVKKVISEDLIGYDSAKDNLYFLSEKAGECGHGELKTFILANIKKLLEESNIDSIKEVSEKLNKLKDDSSKLDFLLKQNRYFQFNGFVPEQKKIIEMTESSVDLSRPEMIQKYLSEISFVYYKDFFFDHSSESFEKLIASMNNSKVYPSTVKNIFNIALFRIFFYRQRLAFGPFLAAGIMLSSLWGDFFIDQYYSFLERMFF